jgi:O-succinylbenzoate synthase
MAKAAIETTAWALAAQKQGVSLSTLLGGTRSEVCTGVSLGIQPSVEALVEKSVKSLDEGYRKIKMKIQPGQDIDYVQAVYDAVGGGEKLMVDANNAYTLDDIDHLKKFDDFNLMMLEQPLAWDDIISHAELQKQLKTPICLDESINNLEHAQNMAKLDSGRIINLKPGRVGGFHQSILIHDFCEQAGIPVWCGGMLESGIGRAHNIALASKSNFTLPGDLSPSRRYWKKDIVTPEWEMDKDGMVRVPTNTPGIGVELDMDHIKSITTRTEELTASDQ